MSLYIRELQKHAEAEQRARDAEAEAAEKLTIEAAEERLAPLNERLGRLLAKLPPDVRARGIGIPQIQPLLRGRQGRQAHQGEIAAALRALGWTSHRSWKRDSPDGFRSVWRPGDLSRP